MGSIRGFRGTFKLLLRSFRMLLGARLLLNARCGLFDLLRCGGLVVQGTLLVAARHQAAAGHRGAGFAWFGVQGCTGVCEVTRWSMMAFVVSWV